MKVQAVLLQRHLNQINVGTVIFRNKDTDGTIRRCSHFSATLLLENKS
jgi:hypothetical protein